MQKILIFSDPHVTVAPETIIGIDPAARLAQALDHAARAHPDAERAVICGDLVHNGRPAEYALVREIVQNRPWPVTTMLGNHDARDRFFEAFPEAPRDRHGFAQSAFPVGGVTLICLDTLDEGADPLHSGVLCDARLAWLDETLAAAPGGAVVCLHHPPVRTGFDAMDAVALRNSDAVMARLAACGKVRLVVAGHVHRAVTVCARGLPVALVKSTCHQMPMQLGAARVSLSTSGPAGYGVLLVDDDEVILHHVDFAPEEPDGAHYD